MVVQEGINHTQSGPIVPDKKSFVDDDDDDEDEDEDEVMHLMDLDPLRPPKKKDWFYQSTTPPPSKTKSIIGPNSAPISAKAEGTPAGTTQLS